VVAAFPTLSAHGFRRNFPQKVHFPGKMQRVFSDCRDLLTFPYKAFSLPDKRPDYLCRVGALPDYRRNAASAY
jgi:hypothetical protein